MARLRCALKWLQSLEPTGVGAANLGECLVLQLRERPRTPARQVAIRICQQHLELLAKRDAKKLMRLPGPDEDEDDPNRPRKRRRRRRGGRRRRAESHA